MKRLSSITAAFLLATVPLLGGCESLSDALTGPLYDELTEQDKELLITNMQNTLEKARDTESGSWSNPVTWHSGTVTVRTTYVTDGGYFCRHYTEVLRVGTDRKNTQDLTACRNDQGVWDFP